MTVLVDTSILIQAQRVPDSGEARELAALLASGEAAMVGPVIMEHLRGARSSEEFEFLRDRLFSTPHLEMDSETWVIAARISTRLIHEGRRLPDMDVVIAAAAIRYNVPLYTIDAGFRRIAELRFYQPATPPNQ